jgi:hypothetical protein
MTDCIWVLEFGVTDFNKCNCMFEKKEYLQMMIEMLVCLIGMLQHKSLHVALRFYILISLGYKVTTLWK